MKFDEILTYKPFNYKVSDSLKDIATEEIFTDFIKFCCDTLYIEKPFEVYVVDNRENYGIKTTAFYNNKNGLVCVYGKNRMNIDIARSIAHELVHKRQYEQGRVPENPQDIGGEIEDEANSVAGIIVKKYIYKGKHAKNMFDL
jgi:hypothetical protein